MIGHYKIMEKLMHEAHRAHVLSQHRWQHNQCSHPRTQNKAGFQSFRKVRSLTGVRAESSTAKADPKAARRKEKEQGRETYRPQSFKELLGDAVEAIEHALEDGVNRMEVDFPTLSGDSYKVGSDDYIDANIQLAISAATEMIEKKGIKVHLIVPDKGEYRRSFKMFKNAFEQTEGLTMGNLRESRKGAAEGLFGYLTRQDTAKIVPPGESAKQADLFIAVNASTVELTDIEKYIQETVGEKPLIIWNMELDTLRSDLGLFGFPSKDVQHRFLCQFKPIFYIRQREYAKTLPQPPYTIGYSGALFREYPGPWQVMFKQQNGVYACVAERKERYGLGEFKEELMEQLGLNTEEKGSALEFLRKGYKNSTWWEDDKDKEQSNAWRS